jgi:CRISPR-associated endonuclease Csn1
MRIVRNSSARSRVGLDIGSNSAGWAAIKLDADGKPCGLIGLGVRIYTDGRNPKDGSSLAVQRRVPRGIRRRRDRHLDRRTDLMNALTAVGLMPADEAERKALEALDPYALRAKALDAPLTPHELGRALFHLNQRRGFKSNRKAGAKEKEGGVINEGIKKLNAMMTEVGARTLGEFLHMRNRNGEMVRARPEAGFYPSRLHYEKEFDAIRAAQDKHHTLRTDQWDTLADIVFHQRPLKPVDPGWCLLEDGERRAHRALPCAQEFRILQEIANLRIAPRGEAARPLTKEQRDKVLHALRTKKEVKLDSLLSLLKLPSDTHVNLLGEDRKSLKGDESAVRVSSASIFGKIWHGMPFDRRTEIIRTLLDTERPEDIERIARAEWGLDEDAAEKLSTVSLPDGYVRLSEKAIGKLLPIMEFQGLNYSEAVAEVPDYGHHSDFRPDQVHDRLPYYGAVLSRQVVGGDVTKPKDDEVGHYGRIANPTVHIGLGQMRRVMNRLIDIHGKPDEIVIELARDLKMNSEEKAAERKKIRENEIANRRREEQARSSGVQSLSPHYIRKLRLWEEQNYGVNRVCPFSGDTITFEMVMSDATEIEHILPFSKTLDDSMANKVLALREVNRVKRDRSPYDAFHSNPTDGKRKYNYEEMLLRADSLPKNKRWRFHPDAMDRFKDEPEFLDRQLNETKYLSRIARQYLAHLYNEKAEGKLKVRAIPGRLTAMLRAKWGLNALLRGHNLTGDGADDGPARKNRDNHMHHAIDAFVIAMTDQRLLHAIANLNSDADRKRLIEEVPLPWDGFTPDELRPHLEKLVVSHKPDHGTFPWMTKGKGNGKGHAQTSGSLHNDTAYGLVGPSKNGNWKVVSRAPLSAFNTPEDMDKALPDIRDRALREALIAEWASFQKTYKPDSGGDSDDKRKKQNPAQAFADHAASKGIKLNGHSVKVRRVRMTEELDVVIIKDKQGRPYKAYKPDGNAFADLYELPDGKWKAVVVRRFDANQSDFDPAKFRPHPAAKKIARLHIDDMVAVGEGDARRILRIVKMSGQIITMADHFEGGALKARDADKTDIFKYFAPSASRLKDLGFRKVGVDEIGRLTDPGPRKPRPAA